MTGLRGFIVLYTRPHLVGVRVRIRAEVRLRLRFRLRHRLRGRVVHAAAQRPLLLALLLHHRQLGPLQNVVPGERLLKPDQHNHRTEEDTEAQRAPAHELIRREVERHDAK